MRSKPKRSRGIPKPWLVDGVDGRVALDRIEAEWVKARQAKLREGGVAR